MITKKIKGDDRFKDMGIYFKEDIDKAIQKSRDDLIDEVKGKVDILKKEEQRLQKEMFVCEECLSIRDKKLSDCCQFHFGEIQRRYSAIEVLSDLQNQLKKEE